MNEPPDGRIPDACRSWCAQLCSVQPVRESFHAALSEISRTFYATQLYRPPQQSPTEWEAEVQSRLLRMNQQAAETLKWYTSDPVAINGPPNEVSAFGTPAQDYRLLHQAFGRQAAQKQYYITPERSEANILPFTLRADSRGPSSLGDSKDKIPTTTINDQAASPATTAHRHSVLVGVEEENNRCHWQREFSHEQAVEMSSDRLFGIEARTGESSSQLSDSASALKRPYAVLSEEEGPLSPRKRTPWRPRNLDEEAQSHQPHSILAPLPQIKTESTAKVPAQTPLPWTQSAAILATTTRSLSTAQPLPAVAPKSDSAVPRQMPPPSNLPASINLSTDDQRTVVERGCPHHFAGIGVWNEDQPVCPEEGCQQFHICKPWWLSLKEPEKQHPGCPHGGENIKHWNADLGEDVLHVRPNCKRTLRPNAPTLVCEIIAEKPCAYGHDHADLRKPKADAARRWNNTHKFKGKNR